MLLRWTEQMSVGDKELDDHHRTLIRLVNDLNDAMRLGQGRDAVGKVLDELADYARWHFEAEEKRFLATDYPGKDKHLELHRTMLAKVDDLREQDAAGKRFLTMEVLQFLQDWLTEHIMKTDKTYARYL